MLSIGHPGTATKHTHVTCLVNVPDSPALTEAIMIRLHLMFIFPLCVFPFEINTYGFHTENLDNLIFNDKFFIKEKLSVKCLSTCALFCSTHDACMSFSFHITKKKCRIYGTTFYRVQDGAFDQGWKYFVFGSIKCSLRTGFIHSRQNSLCLNFVKESFVYTRGKEHCLDLGSNLVTLETLEKIEAFKNTLNGQNIASSFIIGLRHSMGKWRWEDGTELGPEAYWGNNRPRGSYSCAHAIKDWGYKYEDHACTSYRKKIICEQPL